MKGGQHAQSPESGMEGTGERGGGAAAGIYVVANPPILQKPLFLRTSSSQEKNNYPILWDTSCHTLWNPGHTIFWNPACPNLHLTFCGRDSNIGRFGVSEADRVWPFPALAQEPLVLPLHRRPIETPCWFYSDSDAGL